MPPPDSLPGLLLTLTALSGEIPVSIVNRLTGTKAYQAKVVKELKQKGLLYGYVHNSLRGLRLTASGKTLLLVNRPEWFQPYLTGNTDTNLLRSEVSRRLRLHRMAEVLTTMHNIGASAFPWQKPAIFQPVSIPAQVSLHFPAYYSAREIKSSGIESYRIRGSRSTGVLLADGSIFAVYNTGPSQMEWEGKAETRFKVMLQKELCHKRPVEHMADAPVDAIVFASDMGRLATMIGAGDGLSQNHFILNGCFERFYLLTSDHRGETILRLLCDGESRAVLDSILMQDLQPPNAGLPIENDAMDGDMPVLFGYACDMPRLRKFDTALSILDQSGLVICFDYQEEAFRRCLGPRVRLQCLDFEACERTVFPSTEDKKS